MLVAVRAAQAAQTPADVKEFLREVGKKKLPRLSSPQEKNKIAPTQSSSHPPRVTHNHTLHPFSPSHPYTRHPFSPSHPYTHQVGIQALVSALTEYKIGDEAAALDFKVG